MSRMAITSGGVEKEVIFFKPSGLASITSVLLFILSLLFFNQSSVAIMLLMLKFSLKHSCITLSPSAINNLLSSLCLPCFKELMNFILFMLSMDLDFRQGKKINKKLQAKN